MSSTPWTPNQVPNSQFESKASGYILLDGQEVAHTRQCCHCQQHFVSVRGSGHIRGHCVKCDSITCGNAACDVCIPWEKKMERAERAERTGRFLLPGQW